MSERRERWKQFWTGLGNRIRGRASSPDWIVYVLDGHPPSRFYHALFQRAAVSLVVVTVADAEELVKFRTCSNTPFVYIGHGSEIGAYSSVGFGEGLRNFLCDARQSNDFIGSPHIWWSCFSAQWLRRSSRADWFGYAGLLGADPRGVQEDWWNEQLLTLISQVMAAAQSRRQPAEVRETVEQMHEDARRQYYNGRRLSWTSVLCSRFIAAGIDWHPRFDTVLSKPTQVT